MKQINPIVLIVFTLLGGNAPSAFGEREVKSRFKGVELYSWTSKKGDWHFALMDGTNRLKTVDEVRRSANQFNSLKGLEKAMLKLAVGENVFWSNRATGQGLAMPPKKIRKVIIAAAKKARIKLSITE